MNIYMKHYQSLCLSIYDMYYLSLCFSLNHSTLRANPSVSSDLMPPILPQVATGKDPYSLLHNGIFVLVHRLKNSLFGQVYLKQSILSQYTTYNKKCITNQYLTSTHVDFLYNYFSQLSYALAATFCSACISKMCLWRLFCVFPNSYVRSGY